MVMAAVAAHAPRSRWRTVRRQLPNYLFILPHFLFFLVFLSGPVLFGFYISFHSWPILSPEKPFVGLENYEYMVADDIFVKSIGNTIRFAAQTVLMQATFGLLLA